MPTLSINYGVSNVRGVFLDDAGSMTSINYRYPYSSDLYSHFYSEQQYYSDIVDFFIKVLNVPDTNLNIIATGYPSAPTIGRDYASTMSTDQLVKGIDTYDVIDVSDSTVFTQSNHTSQDSTEKLQFGPNEKNYLLNLSLYKNAFPVKPSEYNLLLSNIWHTFNKMRKDPKSVIMSTKPTLFLGDLFATESKEFIQIAYLYLLSFVVNPGVFYLALDKHSDLPHLAHIKKFNGEFGYLLDSYVPMNLGTLINSPSDTTVLLDNEISTSQLIEVKAGKIFFVPLGVGSSVRIVIKSKHLGSVERKVKGGKLGLIIDTRKKSDPSFYDYNQLQVDINTNLKSIREVFTLI